MDYFIGDTHFFDKNIIKFENRPFKNVSEMNEYIIKLWNLSIEDNDRVFINGDFCDFSNTSINEVQSLLDKLHGIKILILGNHDRTYINELNKLSNITIYEYPILYENFYIISHEPIYVNENSPYVNIFAHVHNNPIYKTVSSRSICTSIERWNYTPISFDIIKGLIQSKN